MTSARKLHHDVKRLSSNKSLFRIPAMPFFFGISSCAFYINFDNGYCTWKFIINWRGERSGSLLTFCYRAHNGSVDLFFPALALAISLVFLKVERKANVHWVISIVAATVSAAWMFGIVFFFIGKVEGYGVMRNMFPVFLSFVLGGISTWVAAYWSLPQRQSSE